jgi:hypothetical protein
MTAGRFVLARGIRGISEASASMTAARPRTDPSVSHGQVVPFWVGEIGVVDQGCGGGVGIGHDHPPPTPWRHARDLHMDTPVQQAGLVRGAHREHVQVEQPVGPP